MWNSFLHFFNYVAKKNQSPQVLLHFTIKCPKLSPEPCRIKRAVFTLTRGNGQSLSLEHMLQEVGLREANELSRKEQLAKLTSQGSVYILSALITV